MRWSEPYCGIYAPYTLHVMQETMKTPPAWAAGLALSVEGGWSQSYGACK